MRQRQSLSSLEQKTRVSGHFAKARTSCRTGQFLHKYHPSIRHKSPSAHQTAFLLSILTCLGLLLQIVPSRRGLTCMFVECPSFLDG